MPRPLSPELGPGQRDGSAEAAAFLTANLGASTPPPRWCPRPQRIALPAVPIGEPFGLRRDEGASNPSAVRLGAVPRIS